MEKRILAYRKYMDELLKQLESSVVSEQERAQKEKSDRESVRSKESTSVVCTSKYLTIESGCLQVETLRQEHLTQISFFQHERLVHLIVTVTFAILEMLAVLIALLFPGVATLLLVIVVMILLIPYIRHYFILENEVQKMYGQYDRLLVALNYIEMIKI